MVRQDADVPSTVRARTNVASPENSSSSGETTSTCMSAGIRRPAAAWPSRCGVELDRPLARHAAPPARGVPREGVMLALAVLAAGIGYLAAGRKAALGAACGGIVA